MKKRMNPERRELKVSWRMERWVPAIRFNRAGKCQAASGMVIEPLFLLRKRGRTRAKLERNYKLSSLRNGTRQTWR